MLSKKNSFNKKITFPFLSENYALEDVRIKKYDSSETFGNHSSKNHFHNYTEVHFSLFGDMLYEIDDKEIRISQGEYLLIGKNRMHRRIKEQASALSFHVTYSLAGIAYKDMHEGNFLIAKIPTRIMDTVKSLDESPRDDSLFVRCQTLSLIYDLSGISEDFAKSREEDEYSDRRIETVKDFISDKAYAPLSCADAAKAVHLSVRHLSRLFVSSEGCTLKEYISRARFDFAKKLIANNSLSITQISDYMGFGNSGSFNQFFKKHSGMCPREYRDSLNK